MDRRLNCSLEMKALIVFAQQLCNFKNVENAFVKKLKLISPTCWQDVLSDEELKSIAEKDVNRLTAKWHYIIMVSEENKMIGEKLMSVLGNLYKEIAKFLYKYPILLKLGINIDYKKWCVFDSFGVLDKKRTIEEILGSKTFGKKLQFTIACSKSLENQIYSVWKKMDFQYRCFFCPVVRVKDSYRTDFTYMWLRFLCRQSNEQIFVEKAFSNYCDTVEVMMHALRLAPWENRVQCVFIIVQRCFENRDDLEVCFQLMNRAEKVHICKKYAFYILEYYMHWPRVLEFMEMANYLYRYLTPLDFIDLLSIMYQKKINTCNQKYFDYKVLYLQFWESAPDIYKVIVEINHQEMFEAVVRYRIHQRKINLRRRFQHSLFSILQTKEYLNKVTLHATITETCDLA